MKHLLQYLSNGETSLPNLPSLSVGLGQLSIRSACSPVSAGTELILLEFGKASWIDKARQQPDKVQQVIEKIGTDGILATLDSV